MTVPSIMKHPYVFGHAVRHPLCFSRGFAEANQSNGLTYDDDPYASRSMAYDAGRDLRRWGRC